MRQNISFSVVSHFNYAYNNGNYIFYKCLFSRGSICIAISYAFHNEF